MPGEIMAIEEFDATDLVLREVLRDVLGLSPARTAAFTPETGLFGHLPELDSMAVAGLLTEIEDRLGIVIEDDEVDGEMLETYGALLYPFFLDGVATQAKFNQRDGIHPNADGVDIIVERILPKVEELITRVRVKSPV